jgi:hypothetical protein
MYSTTLMMKTEIVFETSVSTKAEPHYPAENPKDLLQENIKNLFCVGYNIGRGDQYFSL